MATRYEHERMPVFERSRVLYARLRAGMVRAEWADRPLALQLLRASASIVLNIAEGAGEFSPREKARFYRIARRSAAECDGAIILMETSPLMTDVARMDVRKELDEIAAMLTALIKHHDHRPRPSP